LLWFPVVRIIEGGANVLDKAYSTTLKACIDTCIYSGQEPIGDAVFIGLDNRPSILEARSIGERILDKIKEFIEVFVSGMLG
jgi:type I restriction enzyme R subunit